MDGFSHTFCLACRGLAWRDNGDGEVFCPTCDERAQRLAAGLARIARPPVFGSLRSALRATSNLKFPVQVPAL